jgi:FkbM family methyltransferase
MLHSPIAVEGHTFLPSLFAANPVVLDFGMNRGGFARVLADDFGATVHGAEPVSSLFAALPPHPRIKPHAVALGGRNDKTLLFHHAGSDASLMADLHGGLSASSETVEVLSLREFIRRSDVDFADLLKVDIEGAECDMIDTSHDADLIRFGQITVEFHDFLDPRLGLRVEATKARLERAGFRRVNFSLNNGDVLFVRQDLINRTGIAWLLLCKYVQGALRAGQRWALPPH